MKNIIITMLVSLYAVVAFSVGTIDVSECYKDEDCTLINDGCCGCFAAGKRVAVSKILVYDPPRWNCSTVFCAAIISRDPTCAKTAQPVCEKGMCIIKF